MAARTNQTLLGGRAYYPSHSLFSSFTHSRAWNVYPELAYWGTFALSKMWFSIGGGWSLTTWYICHWFEWHFQTQLWNLGYIPPKDHVISECTHRKLQQKAAYDKRVGQPLADLQGTRVYAKPTKSSSSKAWIPGEIIGPAGPRSHLIRTNKNQIRRNRTQIQLAYYRSLGGMAWI